jgi:hypothetical protein
VRTTTSLLRTWRFSRARLALIHDEGCFFTGAAFFFFT